MHIEKWLPTSMSSICIQDVCGPVEKGEVEKAEHHAHHRPDVCWDTTVIHTRLSLAKKKVSLSTFYHFEYDNTHIREENNL